MGKILATHTGSLIRPPELLAFLAAGERGESYDEGEYSRVLRGAVQDVVNRQVDAGIDIVDDGEMGKASWITYLYERVGGLEARVMTLEGASMMPPSRDRQQFPGAYAALDALDEAAVRESNRAADSSEHDDEPASNQAIEWVCTGPITYDRTALDRDIANLRAALEGHDDVQAFMPVVAPASAYWLRNEHYGSEEEFVYGLADALREEYRAIVESGFFVQVDDAVLMHEWDSMLSGQTDDDYRRWAQLRVDALVHALEGLPPDVSAPRVLGKLARPPRLRPAAARHDRSDPPGPRRLLPDGAGQPAP